MTALGSFWRLPEAVRITDLDDAATAGLHRAIIRRKPFLHRLYREWYRGIEAALPTRDPSRRIVEIGSGGGFLGEAIPDVTTSDLRPLREVDLCFPAQAMPFEDESLDAVVLVNVLHHVPEPEAFLRELSRCLKPGGKGIFLEPAVTPWARLIYRRLHHEPFDPEGGWSFVSKGPQSDANIALPWILFERDRELFERRFPSLTVERVRPHTPFLYLLSGGLTWRPFVPSWSFGIFRTLEAGFPRWLNRMTAMFCTIELRRIG